MDARVYARTHGSCLHKRLTILGRVLMAGSRHGASMKRSQTSRMGVPSAAPALAGWHRCRHEMSRESPHHSLEAPASARIALIDRDMPIFRSLDHLLRYRARPPFTLERLSVLRGPDGRITRVRYVLPRHKAANWVGPSRGRKSTWPGANCVVKLSPLEFLDRLVDLVSLGRCGGAGQRQPPPQPLTSSFCSAR
jgi:hypothetical protein